MFVKKLFGGKSKSDQANSKQKKGSGFFLELDESEDNQVVQAVDAVTSKVGSVTATAVDTMKSTVSQVVEEATSDTAKEKVAATPPKNQQETQQQKNVKEKAKTKQTASPTKSAQILQEKIPTSVKPVSDTNGQESAAEMTFAPQYLVPTTTRPRRRPGPSMEMFKDMARQVKTPQPKQ
ncbi:MAG: hypothetical protein ACFB4I_16100 [Cyanophyceae cyanobacterium]